MMEVIAAACPCLQTLAEPCAKILIDGAIREVGYLCCFNTYATKFEEEKKYLIAKLEELKTDIRDARENNQTRVEDVVKLWMEEAKAVIDVDAKTRQKCFFGLCPQCIWQYQHGKELAEKRQKIADLLKTKGEFTRVARPPPKNPGIKYYAPPNFIDFKSRESRSKELKQALKNEDYYMIGLQGLAGMGKTTLALQVGVHVEESKAFQQVIFTTVSDTPDINKIRRDIAMQLNFPLEGRDEQQSKALWAGIANSEGRILIILDDVWNKIELKDIGIPHNHKNCCVLITTCNSKVCRVMTCQRTISLEPLEGGDGLVVFTKTEGATSGDPTTPTTEYNDLAQKLVDACGGAPLALVPMANNFKELPLGELKVLLNDLQNSEPQDNDNNHVLKVRRSLMSSCAKLSNEAKYLLLLCSLFPRDYEIRMEVLHKLAIGLGIFKEANNYSISSSRVGLILAKQQLIDSFLLLQNKEACVKMHDFIRKVVLSMKYKDVQVIMNSSGQLKSNLKFLSWSNNGFPNHLDGTKLEVLLLWIKGEVKVEDSRAIFREMVHLKFLFLRCDQYVEKPSLSLQSFLSLKNIRTLILNDWILGDVSILKHLKTLVTLEFESCLIMELPKEVVKIESLRLLGIRRCRIERNNPFEVIERCSKLEELYFVENDNVEDWKPKSKGENKDEVSQDMSPPILQRYFVACSGLLYFADDDSGLVKCLNTEHVENLMSKEMLKYLVERAEILELCKMGPARWKSLVPDVIPMRDGVMKDLIKLCLYKCADIECLIDNRGSSSNVGVFSHLVELCLDNVGAEDLYQGPVPSSFLSKLKIFKLLHCKKLCNKFFRCNLELPNLTVLQLDDCPMFTASIFLFSVARSLALLEELSIKDCEEVETLIEYPREEEADANHPNSDGSLFPKLKCLKIQGCGKLQLVLSFLSAGDLHDLQELSIRCCGKLEYMFGEYGDEGQVLQKSMLPSLTTMELEDVASFNNICKAFNKCRQRESPTQNDAHGCCCLPSEFGASKKTNETSHPADQLPLTLMEWSTLKHINLGRELVTKPFPHSMVSLLGKQPHMETGVDSMKLLKDMQNLTRVGIRHSEIEEIFNVEGIESEEEVELKLQVLEIEGLHNLRCIYKDPNKILNLCNLKDLVFSGCDKLRAIFSTSTMKRLPQLSSLKVTRCGELVYIIEERKESVAEGTRLLPSGVSREIDVYSHLMFRKICISHCNKLESLFCISTSKMLRKLESLEIEEVSNLKEVFGCRQDTQGRGVQDVIPELSHFKLKNLPNLERFFGGIDVQSVENFVFNFEVVECGIWGKPKQPKRNEEVEEELPSTYSNTGQAMPHIPDVGTSTQVYSHLKGEAKRKQAIETEGQTSALPNLEENIEKVTRETGEEVPFPETSAMVPSSFDSALTRGSSTEGTMETQANDPSPALEKKASETSPAESEMTRTSPHSVIESMEREKETEKEVGKVVPALELTTSPKNLMDHLTLGEAKRKQAIETEGQTSALPNLEENIEEVTRKTGEVAFSETSAMVSSSSDSD